MLIHDFIVGDNVSSKTYTVEIMNTHDAYFFV